MISIFPSIALIWDMNFFNEYRYAIKPCGMDCHLSRCEQGRICFAYCVQRVCVPMYLAFSAMTARSEISPARWRRLFLSWLDGIEAGWAIPLLLLGFIAVWQTFLSIAYIGGDLHPDVLETWTLGRSFEGGYAKHPPLMGWVARAWTWVFPLANWSFQLMALTNSAIALWIVDLISRRFARGDKRLVV